MDEAENAKAQPEIERLRWTQPCPNCSREFYGNVKGEYCPECWRAWCRNDGSFEEMTEVARR